MTQAIHKHRDTIDPSGFARLLGRLNTDVDEAAHEYERLRTRLVKFFDWRGLPNPDECADEVLDRVTHKFEDVAIQDVTKYVYGIARLVALERRRRPVFTSIEDEPQMTLASPAARDESSDLQDCFDRCLSQLPEGSRSLLMQYYEGERQVKISNRRRLATTFGVSDNALRSRVQRLRDQLEQCVRECTAVSLGHTS